MIIGLTPGAQGVSNGSFFLYGSDAAAAVAAQGVFGTGQFRWKYDHPRGERPASALDLLVIGASAALVAPPHEVHGRVSVVGVIGSAGSVGAGRHQSRAALAVRRVGEDEWWLVDDE